MAASPTAGGAAVSNATITQAGGTSTDEVYNVESASAIDAWVDGGTAAHPVGIVARLHVLAATGTTPSLTVHIEHADDNGAGAPNMGSLATVETFGVMSAPGGLTIVDPASTLKRWRRANYTIAGTNATFVFAVAIATF